jgi:hypothetical protein
LSFIGYMFSAGDRWHTRCPLVDVEAAIRFTVEFGDIVPRLMVTDLIDAPVIELHNGQLDQLAAEQPQIFDARQRHPPVAIEMEAAAARHRVHVIDAEISRFTGAYLLTPEGRGGALPSRYDHPLAVLEREILAIAAVHDWNLGRFGYVTLDRRLSEMLES